MTRLTVLAATAALIATSAVAQSTVVRFQNNSGATVYRIYYSPTDNGSWENDVLGSNVLQPGQYLDLTLHNVSNCYYDLLIEWQNGAQMTDVMDLCTYGTYIIR